MSDPQLPGAGWYVDPEDPASERYWDGTRWTDAKRPPEASSTPPTWRRWLVGGFANGGGGNTGRTVVIAVIALLIGWYVLWNTNFGKRLSAHIGIRDCYELTLTGNVVCGDQAEQLDDFRDDAREGIQDFREDTRAYEDCLEETNYKLRQCDYLIE
jgi:hypothetical protein